MRDNALEHVFVFAPRRLRPAWAPEQMTTPETEADGRAGLFIDWPDVIRYRFFYRLLQVVDQKTLLVFWEMLRHQNRHELAYNCLRNFANQTRHTLAFQTLPIIDTWDDFAILFDLDTGSRWKRENVTPEMVREHAAVRVCDDLSPSFCRVEAPVPAPMLEAYAKEKRALVDGIGTKDPHTIPRTLHLMAGKERAAVVSAPHLVRNGRLRRGATYGDVEAGEGPFSVVDLPHNFIDFSDVVTLTRQTRFDVAVSPLKVDGWYFDRYAQWARRVADATAALRR